MLFRSLPRVRGERVLAVRLADEALELGERRRGVLTPGAAAEFAEDVGAPAELVEEGSEALLELGGLRVVDLDASGSVVGFDPDTAVVTSRCGTRALAYVRRSATSA